MKNFETKNSIGFFSLVFLLMMLGCREKPVEKDVIVMPETSTHTTTKETKIIEKEAPPADTTTSITLDKKGLKVETEKVDVKVGN